MIIGIPKETKPEEYRVSAPPMAAGVLVQAGHKVLVQASAGEGSSFPDEEYIKAGATIVKTAEEVWGQAEMIYHVKEPIPVEYPLLRKDQILFTYLHLAPAKELTLALMKSGVNAIAFETVQLPNGSLPLLNPMSEIAGRIAVQVAAMGIGKMYKGCGKLLGGIPGVPPAKVVILGGGIVGSSAAKMALGLGARVVLLDINIERLAYLSEVLHGNFETIASNPATVASNVKDADVVIGAVLIKGARAPIIATKEMVKTMKPGSVIVDVAVDQGGCIETTHPTTHKDPTFIVNDVVHYCVANMPGMYPQTSTIALSNATLPYALELANLGLHKALKQNDALRKGLSIYQGKVTDKIVADALGLEYTPYND